MNKLYLGVIALSLLAVATNALSMEDPVKDDTEITLISQDGKTIRQEYGLLKRSQTVKNIIDDIQEGGVVKVEIPIPNVLGKDWVNIIELLKMSETNLSKELEKKDIQQLAHLINNVNYLDIPSIFQPAIKIMAKKIKASEQYVCNAKSMGKVKNSETLCKDAIHINIPFTVEKETVQETDPIVIVQKEYAIPSNQKTTKIFDHFEFNKNKYKIKLINDFEKRKNDFGVYGLEPVTIIIEKLIDDKFQEIYHNSTDVLGTSEMTLAIEGLCDIELISNETQFTLIFKTDIAKNKYNEYTGVHEMTAFTFINVPTILQKQVYFKKQRGEKLNKTEQEIYDNLMK